MAEIAIINEESLSYEYIYLFIFLFLNNILIYLVKESFSVRRYWMFKEIEACSPDHEGLDKVRVRYKPLCLWLGT